LSIIRQKKRKENRGLVEILTSKSSKKIKMNNDNDEARRMVENCTIRGKRILNPIIDWEEKDVWDFIKNGSSCMIDDIWVTSPPIKYCSLYDEGFERLGCIGCPLSGPEQMLKEFERWPKYKESYHRAFGRMVVERENRGLQKEPTKWHNADEVMNWWIYSSSSDPNQIELFNEEGDIE
jgi:phosphoadenosine phosphosulfate reductase